jgi:citronellyl-CoA dehydrogenase
MHFMLQREVADCAVQFHGGMGYMDENWTSRYFRDTRLDSIGAGSKTAQFGAV